MAAAAALWPTLTRFLDYPELELINNLAENSMRPVALGRRTRRDRSQIGLIMTHIPKVLLVSFHYPPRNTSASTRPFHFAKYLRDFGYDPVVVCAGTSGESSTHPEAIYAPLSDDHRAPGRIIGRIATGIYQKVFDRYSDRIGWVRSGVRSATSSVANGDYPAVVISSSPPLASHLVALHFSRKHTIPWIADFQDPLVGNPFRPKNHLDALIERFIFRSASAVIANTDSVLEMWAERYPQWRPKMHAIWNGFEREEYVCTARSEADDVLRIVHTGNLYGPREPSLVLCSLHRLFSARRIRADRVKIQLIGQIDSPCDLMSRPYVREFVASGILDISDEVPRAEALTMAAMADVLLILDITPGYGQLQLPAKLFDYIQCRKKILAVTTPGSPLARLLPRVGIQHSIAYIGSPDTDFDAAVLAALEGSDTPGDISQEFAQAFSARSTTAELARVIKSVLD